MTMEAVASIAFHFCPRQKPSNPSRCLAVFGFFINVSPRMGSRLSWPYMSSLQAPGLSKVPETTQPSISEGRGKRELGHASWFYSSDVNLSCR